MGLMQGGKISQEEKERESAWLLRMVARGILPGPSSQPAGSDEGAGVGTPACLSHYLPNSVSWYFVGLHSHSLTAHLLLALYLLRFLRVTDQLHAETARLVRGEADLFMPPFAGSVVNPDFDLAEMRSAANEIASNCALQWFLLQ